MVMTRRGVYHNLNESEYAISNGEVAFFFSSRFYMNKYLSEYKEHRDSFIKRLSSTIILDDINAVLLADIHLYKEIEKRGFKAVLLNGKEKVDVIWQELYQYALVKMINGNTQDWLEMHVQK